MILVGQTKEEGNCLAINDALIVFPIDSLISIRLNEKGETQRKTTEGRESKHTHSWLTFTRLRSLGCSSQLELASRETSANETALRQMVRER